MDNLLGIILFIVIVYAITLMKKTAGKTTKQIEEDKRIAKLKERKAEEERLAREHTQQAKQLFHTNYNQALQEISQSGLEPIEIPKEQGIILKKGEKCFIIEDCEVGDTGYFFEENGDTLRIGFGKYTDKSKVYITNHRIIIKGPRNAYAIPLDSIIEIRKGFAQYYVFEAIKNYNNKHYDTQMLTIKSTIDEHHFFGIFGEKSPRIAVYLDKILETDTTHTITCTYCGIDNIVGDTNCRQCGAPLKLEQ